MDKKDNVFKKLLSSIGSMFKRLFAFGGSNVEFDDELMSPREMITKNFFRNRLAVGGLIMFIIMASTVVVGSFAFPVNFNDNAPSLRNTAPGKNFLKVPSKIQKEGVSHITSGVSYSLGVNNDGKVYFWGVNTEGIKDFPEEIKNGKVKDLASGDRHAIAIMEDNSLVAWGLNTFEQGSIPINVEQAALKERPKKVFAGDLFSGLLTEKGTVFIWGSTLNSKLDLIPKAIQGHVVDVVVGGANALYLLDDGTVAVNGLKGKPVEARIPEELQDGSVKIVDIALTNDVALALDDKGQLHIWGSNASLAYRMPEEIHALDVAKIEGARDHFTVLDTSGHVHAWGSTSHAQADTKPVDGKTYDDIYSGYYQTYANKDGKVTGFGFRGFLLGSDDWGRDVSLRLIHGGRITMFIGVISVLISTSIGVLVGLIAGFYGGRIDNLLMRFAEIVSSFPFLPLAITLSTLMADKLNQSQRLFMVMIILGIISWPGLARMIRGQILAEREKDFVLAARALGLPTGKIIFKHILPAVFNIIIVTMTLGYAGNLLTESGLSFLGFGVVPPQPSWGNMLTTSQSAKVIEHYWWQWVLPALCVLLAALSVNLVGDGLREAMDPRANEK